MIYQDSHRRLYHTDCRDMKELADESVHCVVTSPPYWGLRSYKGVPDSVWGDGWKGNLGNEPMPELYISHLVEIFREVRRVLRSDGVVFCNIGDSYWGGGNNQGNKSPISAKQASNVGATGQCANHQKNLGKHPIIKPQDKCLVPFRLAIALQEDGWWIRQDIIWAKNNPMPESVRSPAWVKHKIGVEKSKRDPGKGTNGLPQGDSRHNLDSRSKYIDCVGCSKCSPNDGLILRKGSWRPTEAHEYILMLTKSGDYYCDGEAVRESYDGPINRWGGEIVKRETTKTLRYKEELGGVGATSGLIAGSALRPNPAGRNLRSVWQFPTQSYAGSHYATFPEKLPELCIKAGTSEYGVCSECGKPWARIIKQIIATSKQCPKTQQAHEARGGIGEPAGTVGKSGSGRIDGYSQTLGWKAMCSHKDAKVIPATVLDPFCGTGTTLEVAGKLGRRSIGYEISEDYCKLTIERLRQQVLV